MIPAPTSSIVVTRFYKRFQVKASLGGNVWSFITDYVPKGQWNAVTSYVAKDLVLFEGREYICILAISGNASNTTPVTEAGPTGTAGTVWRWFSTIDSSDF